jgi:serine protease inhibitor
VNFTVDRPFLFEIVDTKTSAPLFLGTVADPRAH